MIGQEKLCTIIYYSRENNILGLGEGKDRYLLVTTNYNNLISVYKYFCCFLKRKIKMMIDDGLA